MERRSIAERFAATVERFVPEPFALAVILLAATLQLGLFVDASSAGVPGVMKSFVAGMFDVGSLAFAFQIAAVLITGYVLAEAPIVRRALMRLASAPRTPRTAVATVAATTMALSVVSWGLGLISGAVLARASIDAFRRRGETAPEGLLGAAGFTGMAVWHGGLSGSAPLAVAKAVDPAKPTFLAGVPLSDTIFLPRSLIVCGALFAVVPFVLAAMAPKKASASNEAPAAPPPTDAARGVTPWDVLLGCIIAVPIFGGLAYAWAERGAAVVDLNFVIAASFALGLSLHGGLTPFAAAFERASGAAGSILMQFPIYFGLVAVAKDTGLLKVILDVFMGAVKAIEPVVGASGAAQLLTFWSACVLNVFVPSGGGQWAVQGPVIAETAARLRLPPGEFVMAFAYGDQCTNMLQPFWALPLLSITRIAAGKLLARTAVLCVVLFVLFSVAVLF